MFAHLESAGSSREVIDVFPLRFALREREDQRAVCSRQREQESAPLDRASLPNKMCESRSPRGG
jgi:hypothetical protein